MCNEYRCQLVQGAVNDNKICFKKHLELLYTFSGTFWTSHALVPTPCNAKALLKLASFGRWRYRRNRSWNRCSIDWPVSSHRLIAINKGLHSHFLLGEIHFCHISIIIHELLYFIPNLKRCSSNREHREKIVQLPIYLHKPGSLEWMQNTFWTLRVRATSLLFKRRTRSKFNVLIFDVSSSSNGYASISNSAAFRARANYMKKSSH